MSSDWVTYEIIPGSNVAKLTLTGKAGSRHLLTLTLIKEFQNAINWAVQKQVDGLVTVHDGEWFSGGLNYDSAPEQELVGALASLSADLIQLPFPTAACLSGSAYGAGLTLALTHDFLVLPKASSSVTLWQNEVAEKNEVPSFAVALLRDKFPSSASTALVVDSTKVTPPDYAPITEYVKPYLGWTVDQVVKLLGAYANRIGPPFSAARKSLLAEVWAQVKPTKQQG